MYTEYDTRMKENYEIRSRSYLTRKIPVIIRIDGKCFSSFCKRFVKPYDQNLNHALNDVLMYLCKNIQGAKFGERHSDELSILVTDYDNLQTDAFFDYEVQKICSVTAAMATAEFCKTLTKVYRPSILKIYESWPCFDSRCFNLPTHEISNYFWWRMLDSKRGSINMLAQSEFSHKSLQGLSSDELQEKLWKEKGINWANLPQGQKIGFICVKKAIDYKMEGPLVKNKQHCQFFTRNRWIINASPDNKTDLDSIIKSIDNVL